MKKLVVPIDDLVIGKLGISRTEYTKLKDSIVRLGVMSQERVIVKSHPTLEGLYNVLTNPQIIHACNDLNIKKIEVDLV